MYHALYRKYRPSDFDSVVGQDAIIKTLKNSIKNHNFSHAYMFFGPRGTGKTTVSKIFARNVNCLSPVDGIACQKCEACQVSFSHDCIDIIEIDAASNNGVNEIRELRNNVNLVPSSLHYKVYIVDEVHMLSDAAFNALLKTLEEPPEHIIFILATTDPQKVPETIISRCQCFSFKRISNEMIRKRLEYVCKEEKIKIEDSVLDRIAVMSDGGLRDALGLLDKMVSYTNDKITLEDFNEVNGILSDDDLYQFISHVMNGNIQEVLSDISNFNNSGKNLIQIMIQLADFVRNMIVDSYLSHKECSFDLDFLQEFENQLNDKMFDIKKSSNTKVFIEMFLLKFINDIILHHSVHNVVVEKNNSLDVPVKTSSVVPKDTLSQKESIESKSDLNNNDFSDKSDDVVSESGLNNNDFSEKNEDVVSESNLNNNDFSNFVPKVLNLSEIMDVRINNTMATADKNLLKLELNNFDLLRDYSFDQEIGYLVNSILDSKIRAVGPDYLIISYDSDASVEQNLAQLFKLNEVYSSITNSNKKLAIVSDDKWDQIRNEYIENLKNKVKYELKEEPEVILEEIKNDDIISSSAISLFGKDIVEIE